MHTNFLRFTRKKSKKTSIMKIIICLSPISSKYLPGTDALLDIGAGTGLASYALRSEFKTLTLAEPSAECWPGQGSSSRP